MWQLLAIFSVGHSIIEVYELLLALWFSSGHETDKKIDQIYWGFDFYDCSVAARRSDHLFEIRLHFYNKGLFRSFDPRFD